MIISASRRTDIPAFFHDWFYNRIKAGYVFVRNPMNIHQISKINISPNIVDCIVLWTKNPQRFIESLELLNEYIYYFQYTITGYGQALEPNVPKLDESIHCFQALSKKIGAERVIWRYDPIVITDKFNINYHGEKFRYIANKLASYTKRCVISFVDYYKKTVKNMADIKYINITDRQIIDLTVHFNDIAKKNNILVSSCAEEIDLEKYGIEHGKCIDDKLIEEISGFTLKVKKDKNQRQECDCVASVDIGDYNTCPHGCLYCYANYDPIRVRKNYAVNNCKSEVIYGNITLQDVIKERKIISCRVLQQTFEDKLNFDK